jgi:prepilin-type processing-associated H-X9-DG protein
VFTPENFGVYRHPFGNFWVPTPPLKLSRISAFRSLSSVWALVDADQVGTSQMYDWWRQLPSQPVHGSVRNYLFFDGHVKAYKVTPEGTY